MNRQEHLSLVLELLGKRVAELPDNDLIKLVNGTHSIMLKIIRNRVDSEDLIDSDSIDLVDITGRLEDFSNRTIASDYLKNNKLSKKSLQLLARHLEIAASKQDKAEDLIKKIIEATVGARLRSSAIRGPGM